MNATWYNLSMFYFLWLLPVLILCFLYGNWKKKQSLALFAEAAMLKRITANISPIRRFWKKFFFLCGILFLILAMARPAWNPVPKDVKRQGRDVVFLLDVSRSMLADDLKPNRLERAKLAIDDCLEILEGDRIALVVFAGNSVIRCPLTQDYGFFRMMLSDIDFNSVSRGGTLIGDALRKVEKDVFDQQDRQYKDIVLITDGEDHESFPLEAARKIGKKGIRLIAVGLGNDTTGTPIVITNENGQKEILKYNGQPVRSRLDSNTLRQMVNATPGGRYLPVATGNIDLGHIYRELIAKAAKHEIASQTIQKYEEKFQIFLLAAMIFLGLSIILSDRRKNYTALLLLISCGPLMLEANASDLKNGNNDFRKGDYKNALRSYQNAAVKHPNSPYLFYNQALSHYRLKNYTEAEKNFRKALQSTSDNRITDKNLNARCRMGLAYSCFRQGQRQMDSNLKKTLENYEKSITELKSLQKENPSSETISKNLKNIELLTRKLKCELAKQQQQQQKAMQQTQKQSRKLNELSQKQKQAAGQSRNAEQKKDQSEQTQKQLSEQQQNLNRETQQLRQDRQKQQQQNQTADQHLQNASEHQKKAGEALDRKDYKNAEKQQQKAAEDLQKAKEELDRKLKEQQKQQKQQEAEKQAAEQKKKQDQDQKKSAEQQKKDDSQNRPNEQNAQQQDQTDKQEQLNMSDSPQDILEEERRNQRERGRHLQMRQRPVDKNW